MSLLCKDQSADPERGAHSSEGTSARIALLLALLIFAMTIILPSIMRYPEGLSLTRLIRGIPVRALMTAVTTGVLVAPVIAISSILSFATKRIQGGLLGQLVRVEISSPIKLKMFDTHLLRPLQGIGLSLIFSERLLQMVELTGEATYSRLLVRLILPFVGNVMVSLLLSNVWAFDDLGFRFYFKKTGEVRTAGSNVGLILPLITGVIGAATLFRDATITKALMDLTGMVMILYPPYVFFAIIHHEFVRRKASTLLRQLRITKVETNLTRL